LSYGRIDIFLYIFTMTLKLLLSFIQTTVFIFILHEATMAGS